MPKYSARRALLWQLIAKNRERRLALHTALRTAYQKGQLLRMLYMVCLTVLLFAMTALIRDVRLIDFPKRGLT